MSGTTETGHGGHTARTRTHPQTDRTRHGGRWRARPVLAWIVRALLFVLPLLVVAGVTLLLSRALPGPASTLAFAGHVITHLTVSVIVWIAAERVVRRALPTVTLLRLSLLFPDEAPSRFRVARRSASLRDLAGDVQEAKRFGLATETTRAAEILLSLVAGLSAHDRRTRGHSERVRVYTDMLAAEMGLSEVDQSKLRWAALLHDIGKLEVPTGVLNKPDRLDGDEWDIVRDHPIHGARIAAPLMPWLGQWGAVIVQHHERFDGGGYPHGLVGESISEGARIVSVADAYECMTAARSYKLPMSPQEARVELARQAGRQFDPKVVRAFLRLSLRRLTWMAGPVAILSQASFLREAWVGARSASIPATAGSATSVAGVAVLAMGALAAAPGAGPRVDTPTVLAGGPVQRAPTARPLVRATGSGDAVAPVVSARDQHDVPARSTPAPPLSGRRTAVVAPAPELEHVDDARVVEWTSSARLSVSQHAAQEAREGQDADAGSPPAKARDGGSKEPAHGQESSVDEQTDGGAARGGSGGGSRVHAPEIVPPDSGSSGRVSPGTTPDPAGVIGTVGETVDDPLVPPAPTIPRPTSVHDVLADLPLPRPPVRHPSAPAVSRPDAAGPERRLPDVANPGGPHRGDGPPNVHPPRWTGTPPAWAGPPAGVAGAGNGKGMDGDPDVVGDPERGPDGHGPPGGPNGHGPPGLRAAGADGTPASGPSLTPPGLDGRSPPGRVGTTPVPDVENPGSPGEVPIPSRRPATPASKAENIPAVDDLPVPREARPPVEAREAGKRGRREPAKPGASGPDHEFVVVPDESDGSDGSDGSGEADEHGELPAPVPVAWGSAVILSGLRPSRRLEDEHGA